MHRLLTESIPSRRKGTRNLSKECAKRHRHRRARDRDLRARCRTESGIEPSSPAIPAAIPAARTSDSRSSQSLTVSAVDAFGRHSSLICKCTTGELLKGEHSRQRPGLGTNRVCNRKMEVQGQAACAAVTLGVSPSRAARLSRLLWSASSAARARSRCRNGAPWTSHLKYYPTRSSPDQGSYTGSSRGGID